MDGFERGVVCVTLKKLFAVLCSTKCADVHNGLAEIGGARG